MNDPHTQDTNSQAVASELAQMFEQAIEQPVRDHLRIRQRDPIEDE